MWILLLALILIGPAAAREPRDDYDVPRRGIAQLIVYDAACARVPEWTGEVIRMTLEYFRDDKILNDKMQAAVTEVWEYYNEVGKEKWCAMAAQARKQALEKRP